MKSEPVTFSFLARGVEDVLPEEGVLSSTSLSGLINKLEKRHVLEFG